MIPQSVIICLEVDGGFCRITATDTQKRFLRFKGDMPKYMSSDIIISFSDDPDTEKFYNVCFNYHDIDDSLSHHVSISIQLDDKRSAAFLTAISGLALEHISLKLPFLKGEYEQHSTDNYEMENEYFDKETFESFKFDHAFNQGFRLYFGKKHVLET